MLEALKALSTFFVENSLRTRRNLRGDIERRSLAINEEFVHIFKQVKEVAALQFGSYFAQIELRNFKKPCPIILKTSSDGNSAITLGRLFQWWIILTVKKENKFFLLSRGDSSQYILCLLTLIFMCLLVKRVHLSSL